MPLAPSGTFYYIGKAKKKVKIRFIPEDLANRLESCKTLDAAILKEYETQRVLRLTRENITDIAKNIGTEIEMVSLMGATKIESLNLKKIKEKGVKLIIVKDSTKDEYNIREVLHERFTNITGSGMFVSRDLNPQGALLSEGCFLLLGFFHTIDD